MKKTAAAIALVLILIAAELIYPAAVIVTDITDGTATVATSTGYTYTTPAEDYMLGDIVVCVMWDAGERHMIADDVILAARWSGWYLEFFDFR